MNAFIKSLFPALCGLAVIMSGCQKEGPTPGAPKEKKSTAVPVKLFTVTNAAWDREVAIIGTLYPKDSATIAAQVEGSVEKTLVEFGDRVRSNQDLAFIDTTTFEALVEQAAGALAKTEATLLNAKQNFARITKLKQDGVASESDFDTAKAALDQAEADVKAARGTLSVAKLNLAHSRVQAPFDGAISQRIVGRGDFAKVGTPLFSIVNDSVLKFIFQVPERYASYVEKKLPVSFNVDNYPGETFTGTVYLISPEVSATSRAFNVGALVTNTNFKLKASTFARGSLVIQKGAPTTVVPLDAVVSFAGVTKVFVLENNLARSRTVKAGRIRDGLQEITEGIKPGDKVVISGQSRLSDGMAAIEDAGPPKQAGAKSGQTSTNQGKQHE
jgi:membrane fusion protein (multidrug efflux system)